MTINRRQFSFSLLSAPLVIETSQVNNGQKADTLQWQKLNTIPYKGKQDDIYFINHNIGWYGNGEGKLYKTIDGGDNWLLVNHKAGTFIRALGFVDENIGFIGNVGTEYYPGVTDSNPLYRTDDGGKSWKVVEAQNIGIVKGICGIHILHRKTIYQGNLIDNPIIHAAGRVGGPAALLKSIDGGNNWHVQDLSHVAGMIFDVFFFDENVGFLCSSTSSTMSKGEAQILRTIDGGKNWVPVYKSGRAFENSWKMNFASKKVGYATIQSYDEDKSKTIQRIIKTNDGGKSWKEQNLVDNKMAREFGVGFVNEKLGFVGTRTGGFETTDGGKTWRANNLGQAINKIRIIKDGKKTRLFAIGVDIWRLDINP